MLSLGLTKTGQGARIEAISRAANSFLVPGMSPINMISDIANK